LTIGNCAGIMSAFVSAYVVPHHEIIIKLT
jgi:hypothetical protein